MPALREVLGDRQVDPTEQGTAVKTVPMNAQPTTPEPTAWVADLPEEISLALADIVGVAREGLLAMSVATGMAVMQAMFAAEVTSVAGVKGKHDPDGQLCGTAPRRAR